MDRRTALSRLSAVPFAATLLINVPSIARAQDAGAAPSAAQGPLLGPGVSIMWLGHSAFLITLPNGKVILTDPWLDNPKAPPQASAIQRADVILVSHGHFDHLGNTVQLAKSLKSSVVSNFEIGAYLGSQGVPSNQSVGMNKGGTAPMDGFSITMVSADHSSGISGEQGAILYGGEAGGYVIRLDDGTTLYHAGDTNTFGDMRLISDFYGPTLAMLPIDGFFNMGPFEAARAARMLGVKAVIPMHYGTFPILAGTPDQLLGELSDSGIQVVAMNPGDTIAG